MPGVLLILSQNHPLRQEFFVHFLDEKMEAWRAEVTCPSQPLSPDLRWLLSATAAQMDGNGPWKAPRGDGLRRHTTFSSANAGEDR